VQTLRAKGLSEWAVTRHVLKNSLPQVLAVMGLQFGYLLGGSILVETVFTWPGSGFLLSKAIINRDVPVLQGTILTLSLVFVAIKLVVDLLAVADRPAHSARLSRGLEASMADIAELHSPLEAFEEQAGSGDPGTRLLAVGWHTACGAIPRH